MSSIVYLVTGANRPDGVGFQSIKVLLENPATHIIATVRNPDAAVELKELGKDGRVDIVKAEVSSLESVKAAFEVVAGLPAVKDHGIDVLWANAGVMINEGMTASKVSQTDIEESISANLYGAVNSVQVFLPLLRLGTQKKIVYTSSALGSTTLSIGFGQPGNVASYGISKAAANHFIKRLSDELASEDFTVVSYHPGLVGTSMNGNASGDMNGIKILTPGEAGRLAADLITSWGFKDNGKFYLETGGEAPW